MGEHIGPRLTVGMATYDDYDGVYFTVQALCLYHPEVTRHTEIVVLDNNPGGKAEQHLRNLANWVPNLRYVPDTSIKGTAARELIFQYAEAPYVVVMDCHVLLAPGSVLRLIDYFNAHPDTPDLLQGPMLYDDLNSLSTQFDPVWGGGMLGQWGADERGKDPDGPPFEISMQGLGLFACRKDAWPGFNPRFRGFGGEEFYIHEKFRQRGGRVLCLPFLRWTHRFGRPFGVPYPNTIEDRYRNYLIGWGELGLDLGPVREHFREFLDEDALEAMRHLVEQETVRSEIAIS